MPSPIAHTAAGYAIYRLSRKYAPDAPPIGSIPMLLITTVGFSLLPDVDSGVGLATGQFGRFHNNLTHSLFVGLLAALIFGLIMRYRGQRFLFWFVIALLCYEMHIVMDAVAVSRGVMAFWPFTSQRYVSPVPIFYGLHWSDGWLSTRHLWTLLTEAGFVAVLWALLHFITAAEKRQIS